MNQGFKWKYNQMQENNPAQKDDPDQQSPAFDDKYKDVGHTRNICFVWQDGKRIFLNYAYLIFGDYNPDESVIKLSFTTHDVILKGVNMEDLFYEVMEQVTKQIVCTDSRYNIIGEDQKFVVNHITVNERKA